VGVDASNSTANDGEELPQGSVASKRVARVGGRRQATHPIMCAMRQEVGMVSTSQTPARRVASS
jgi:hypothetical protein